MRSKGDSAVWKSSGSSIQPAKRFSINVINDVRKRLVKLGNLGTHPEKLRREKEPVELTELKLLRV